VSLLSLWFGLSQRVDRRAYFLSGAGLMLVKYLVDAAVVRRYTGQWWSPLDYLSPLGSVRATAWVSLLFFVPYAKYLLMLVLSVLPTVPRATWRARLPTPELDHRLKSALLGIGAALAITIPTVLLGVYFKRSYSFGLFLGTPFTAGWVSGQVFNARPPRGAGETIRVALLATVLAGGVLLAFAAEGAALAGAAAGPDRTHRHQRRPVL
jgi:hypothetical protein